MNMSENGEKDVGQAVPQARFRIKTPAGEVEVAGSEGFVERRWDDVQAALKNIGETPQNFVRIDATPEVAEVATPEIASRRASGKKRSGPSCASRILAIKESGFFSAARKAGEVVTKLEELATPYEGKHVAAALIYLTSSGKLRRLRGANGEWAYINL